MWEGVLDQVAFQFRNPTEDGEYHRTHWSRRVDAFRWVNEIDALATFRRKNAI